MWERLSEPWQSCVELAWEASQAGCVAIGAVVTDASDRIVARGRNRLLERAGAAGTVFGNPLAHAELNALVALDYRSVDYHSCILHTTVEPCPLCTGAFYMSGVRQVRYASRDPFGGGMDIIGKTPYMSRKPIVVVPPSDPDFEDIMVGWHLGYALDSIARRPAPFSNLLAAYDVSLPRGTALARKLFTENWLGQFSAAGMTAGEALDRCEEMLAALGVERAVGVQ